MRVCVETYSKNGTEVPRKLHLDTRSLDIAEVVDRWYGEDYCYFKVKTAGGDTYILRFDEDRSEWALTMFQSAQPHVVPREFQSKKRPASTLTM
ncbi:MAG: PH domain-containing protein [Pseudolabrys sp.]|jgi:hypothetical protein